MQTGVSEENDGVYEAMLAHKQLSLNNKQFTARDRVSIRESDQVRKAQAADHAARYLDINNGMDHRIKTSTGIHPISAEECDVYTSLLDSCEDGSAFITPCVNHAMSANGDIEGFRFTCRPCNTAKCLPVNRRMFHRTSMVECNTSDSRVERGHNHEALTMILKHEEVLDKLTRTVQKLHADSVGNEASFDCMPDNLDRIHTADDVVRGGFSEPLLGSFMCRRAADCKVIKIHIKLILGDYSW
jgi:hypothetical protein